MSEPFVYISTYTTREGHFEEALERCREVAQRVESLEPGMLVFQFFADPEARQITCLQVHSTPESMTNHMSVISDHLAQSGSWIDAYSNAIALGQPPAAVVQWYREAGEPLALYPQHVAGLTRIGQPASA